MSWMTTWRLLPISFCMCVCVCVKRSRSDGLHRRGRGTETWRTVPPDVAEETSQTLSEPARILPQESRRSDSQGQRSRGKSVRLLYICRGRIQRSTNQLIPPLLGIGCINDDRTKGRRASWMLIRDRYALVLCGRRPTLRAARLSLTT